jgi:hypothetical protein
VVTLHARYSTDSWSSQKVEVLSQVDRQLQDTYPPQDPKRRFQAYEEDADQAGLGLRQEAENIWLAGCMFLYIFSDESLTRP